MGIQRFGLFNQALLGKWLWCFGNEATHMGRLVEVGALELLEGLMAMGCGRTLGKLQRVSLVMWCMWQKRVIAFSSSTTLGAVLFL